MSALLGRMGLAGCTSALLILSALEATAQPEARGKAAAEALFQEGKALFDQGKYEEACAKFAASQELDGGFGTLMNLGECFERRGMTASAWATFKEAAGLARNSNQTDRETAARDRATRLETSLSKVIVRAAPSVMETPGLTVRLNGTPLPRAVWGSAVPVDPGTQHLEVAAPGYRAWSATLNVPTGPGQTPVDLPPLVREQAEGPGSTTLPTTPTQSKPLTGKPPAADDGTTQRTLGYVLGGAGGRARRGLLLRPLGDLEEQGIGPGLSQRAPVFQRGAGAQERGARLGGSVDSRVHRGRRARGRRARALSDRAERRRDGQRRRRGKDPESARAALPREPVRAPRLHGGLVVKLVAKLFTAVLGGGAALACASIAGISKAELDSDLCALYCEKVMANCQGEFEQYSQSRICELYCATLPPGEPGDETGNTVACRLHHAEQIEEIGGEEVTLCPIAGPGGAGVCGGNCEGFCAANQAVCDPELDLDDCVADCEALVDLGTYDTSIQEGGSVQCRLYHVSAATINTVPHCGHAAGASPCDGP